MADIYGKLETEAPGNRANGTAFNAGVRSYRNVFDLAEAGGGNQDDMVAGTVREGNAITAVIVASTVSLTGVNFTVGTDAEPAKYCAAQAGPGANATKTLAVKVDALAADALEKPEVIKLFASAALPAAGTIVTRVEATKR